MNEQMTLFESAENLVNEDNKYSKAIKIPQYVPSAITPTVQELCNTSKYSELVANIKKSNVSDEEKDFLVKAATRHIVFNYAKIADYYAHATPEMQKLMEQSALVIIDFDDAIANGYVTLSEKMKSMIQEQKQKDGKA